MEVRGHWCEIKSNKKERAYITAQESNITILDLVLSGFCEMGHSKFSGE
jgi:hypothetical protein